MSNWLWPDSYFEWWLLIFFALAFAMWQIILGAINRNKEN